MLLEDLLDEMEHIHRNPECTFDDRKLAGNIAKLNEYAELLNFITYMWQYRDSESLNNVRYHLMLRELGTELTVLQERFEVTNFRQICPIEIPVPRPNVLRDLGLNQ